MTQVDLDELAEVRRLLQAEVAKREVFERALEKINAIRNNIVGSQSLNWSEHAYPLVAALDVAGIEGQPYPEAREYVGTLLERVNRAENALSIWRETLPREGFPARLLQAWPLERLLLRIFVAWVSRDHPEDGIKPLAEVMDVDLLGELEARGLWPTPEVAGR